MIPIFINVTSAIIFFIISTIIYLLLLYIRRPGRNEKRKDVFMGTLSSVSTENEYAYNRFKICAVVSEVDYGVKVWHTNEDVKKYRELRSIYDEYVKSYSGSPRKIINRMEQEFLLPPKQNLFKRIKAFIYLWWALKGGKNSCYCDYFKLCSLFHYRQ